MKLAFLLNLLSERLWLLGILCVVPPFALSSQPVKSGEYKNPVLFCPPHDQNNFRCVKYIKNYDGDTIRFHIPGVHHLIGKDIRVRVAGIDTFEIKTTRTCEKQKALEAQRFVERWLKTAQRIDLENVKRGRYFRIVADVTVDGVALGPTLLKQNLALPYGKKHLKNHPCHAKSETPAQKPPPVVQKKVNF